MDRKVYLEGLVQISVEYDGKSDPAEVMESLELDFKEGDEWSVSKFDSYVNNWIDNTEDSMVFDRQVRLILVVNDGNSVQSIAENIENWILPEKAVINSVSFDFERQQMNGSN